MAKKITLEELMMPLIDDAANVFYSKLVSLLDAVWGQVFVLKSWCGWHRHRQVGFKWKYGAFSSYATDRKCVIDLNTIPREIVKGISETNKKSYLRAVYQMDMSKIQIDTTESISNTGGAPVPTYRIDTDAPLTLIGYTISTESRDFIYGAGTGDLVVRTNGTDGEIKDVINYRDLPRPYITILVGTVTSFADVSIQFDPVYRNGILDDDAFKLNRKTTIYPQDSKYLQSIATKDVTQGTKYEWDCGRVFEYAYNDTDTNTVWWKYYSLDSDGMEWLLESSERPSRQNNDIMLPFLNSLSDMDYFFGGAGFRRECLSADKQHFKLTVWKLKSHVMTPKEGVEEVYMRFTQHKMHKQEPYISISGKHLTKGIPKYKISKLSSLTRNFLYVHHTFHPSIKYLNENLIFTELFNNCVFFIDHLMCRRSAYDIARRYKTKITHSLNADVYLLLIAAFSNVSLHYLFNGYPKNSLTHALCTTKETISGSLTANDMKQITKLVSVAMDMTVNPSTGIYEHCGWDKIWTPYIFVKNATMEEYKASGGTLVKFVNIGTDTNPIYYRIERTSTEANDFGIDNLTKHTFVIEAWSENDLNKYYPASSGMNVSIPGMYTPGFQPHQAGRLTAISEPTEIVYRTWSVFMDNMAALFNNTYMGDDENKPRRKYALVTDNSMTMFMDSAQSNRHLRLTVVTDTDTGHKYLKAI